MESKAILLAEGKKNETSLKHERGRCARSYRKLENRGGKGRGNHLEK